MKDGDGPLNVVVNHRPTPSATLQEDPPGAGRGQVLPAGHS